jgi:hypothetical protein
MPDDNWFISYAHQQGFGRVILTTNSLRSDDDLAHVEDAIQQRFGYPAPPIVLYYRRMDQP